MDTLFSPEGLMMLGLNILGSDASNPFQALGQAGLATLKGMKQQQVDPMAELKMQYEQMRIRNLQDQIENRQFDNEFGVMKWEEDRARQKALDDLRRSQWDADYAYRAAEDERRRIAREKDEDKPPTFRPSTYPDLESKQRELDKILGKPDMVPNELGEEVPKYNLERADELISDLEIIANDIGNEYGEEAATPYVAYLERARATRDKRAGPSTTTPSSGDLSQYYQLTNPFTGR